MLRLSRMNDYAVVVMGHMANRNGDLVTTVEIAEATGIPATTISQVLKKLSHANLVTSQRGARGGYSMKSSPEDISVADIVAALEGPVALTACVDGVEGSCSVETLCPMRGGWEKVNSAIREALDSVSLAEMLMPFAEIERFDNANERSRP